MAQVTGTHAPAPPAGPALPERYSVLSLIGTGGMASIWTAEDGLLRRRVAIKVLAEQFTQQPRFVARFAREARTAGLLSDHPHVVTIYDVGEQDGRPFIVMEHLAGGTLAERMAGDRPALPEVLRWLGEAASALDYAHEKGVVHRDVKPRNLLFDDRGRLAVGDFGIARAAFEEQLTATDELLGTAAYISPEQALGEPATPASDRYAFAVVAFEALTGGLPFGGGTLVEIAQRRTTTEPPCASERSPELPPAVDDVVLRGLARDPAERWDTATGFVQALEHALDRPLAAASPPPSPPPEQAPVAWSRPRRRFPIAPVLLALAAIVVGTIVGLTVLSGDDGGGRPERSASSGKAAEQKRSKPAREKTPQQQPPAPTAGSPAQLNDEGFRLMNAGRYDAAIPVLQRAVAAFPKDSRDLTLAYALYNLGRSLRLAGRPAEAIPVLERRLGFKNQRGVVKRELKAAQRAAGGGGGGGGGGKSGGDEEGD
jgi:serine/threonine-protein kinase